MTYGVTIVAICVGLGGWNWTPVPVEKKGKMQVLRNFCNSTETTPGISFLGVTVHLFLLFYLFLLHTVLSIQLLWWQLFGCYNVMQTKQEPWCILIFREMTRHRVNHDVPGARLHLISPKRWLMKEKKPHSDSAKAHMHLHKGSYKKISHFVFWDSNPDLFLTPLRLQQRNWEKSCRENLISPQWIPLFSQRSILNIKNGKIKDKGLTLAQALTSPFL